MPKRRPIVEFRDLSGFLGSPPPRRGQRHSSRLTDESPVPPSVSVSSRHRSVRSHGSPPRRAPKNRHKRKRRRHRRRARHTSTARHRHTRRSAAARHDRSPSRQRSLHEEDFIDGTHLSRNGNANLRSRSPWPSGYPDEFDADERAVDPQLEHTFSPTGQPENQNGGEGSGSDEGSGFQRIIYGDGSEVRERARRHHGRHRHRRHGRGKRHRRRRRHQDKENSSSKGDQNVSENRDDGTEDHKSDSESMQYDEEGNPIPPSERKGRSSRWGRKHGKGSQDDGEGKKGKKRNIVKIAALALGAVVVGLVARKIIGRRRKKKADEEAKIAAAQQEAEAEAAGPYGGSGGQLHTGSNPLQLNVPKTSLSVKVPESEAFIVERGGKYNRRLNPGSNTLVPFVDRIAFRFSLKEVSMAVPPQQCYTRENISVVVSALLFAKVEDAVAAAYGVDDARQSLMLVAQISMRKEIARLGLEQMLLDRDGLGDRILADINRASRPWGVRCTRFEVRDFDIPQEIREAFARHAQIERQVQADVLASQGANEAMKHRADGELHAQMRMSQAQGINMVNKATAEAQAISERGQAIAGALRDVAEVANEPGGKNAMHMRIAEQYIHAYMKATEGREDLPPIPTAADVADALGKGLGFLDTLGEPGTRLLGDSGAPGESAMLPSATPALEHETDSGHGVTVNPMSSASMGGSSYSLQGHETLGSSLPIAQGAPLADVEGPPLVGGTQRPAHTGSSHSQAAVQSETGQSMNSHSTQRMRRQAAGKHNGLNDYNGPLYPQA